MKLTLEQKQRIVDLYRNNGSCMIWRFGKVIAGDPHPCEGCFFHTTYQRCSNHLIYERVVALINENQEEFLEVLL